MSLLTKSHEPLSRFLSSPFIIRISFLLIFSLLPFLFSGTTQEPRFRARGLGWFRGLGRSAEIM